MIHPSVEANEGLDRFLAERAPELREFRRDLHAHPELSWHEHRTTNQVRERLAEAGIESRPLVTDTGLRVDLGEGDGPVVLLRGDIDALALDDEKEVPYRSTVPGVCHGCGHDVHTTVLLGALLALHELGIGPTGRVRALFQPAEEAIPGGAERLADTDLMDGVSVVYAMHCDPSLETGKVGMRTGPITSAADRVRVRLHGPGGHTARPHLTTDLVGLTGKVITDLPPGLARLTDVRDGATLVFGSVQSGTAANVIPTHAEVAGTLRVRGRGAWEAAPELLERLLDGLVAPWGATYELEYLRGSPPIENDEKATEVLAGAVQAALGPAAVTAAEQSVGNEDFSWLLERAPGSYARLGVRPPGDGGQLDIHSSVFDVDEEAIGVGVRVFVHAALAGLVAYV